MDDPVPTYTHLVKKLANDYSNLAYLHVVEPDEYTEREGFKNDSSEFIRKIWSPRPYLSASGYNPEKAIKAADANDNTAIVFGKWFISNVCNTLSRSADKTRKSIDVDMISARPPRSH